MTLRRAPLFGLVVLALLLPHPSQAVNGRIGFHGVGLEPQGDMKDFASTSYAAAAEFVFATRLAPKYLAFELGAEFTNFNSGTVGFDDPISGEPMVQETSQSVLRFTVGALVGLHQARRVQPWVGAHLAYVEHNVNPIVSVPGDADLEDAILLASDIPVERKLGADVGGGLNVRIFERVGLYGGFKYLWSQEIDVHLGQEIVKVKPEYSQFFAGISYDFGLAGDALH